MYLQAMYVQYKESLEGFGYVITSIYSKYAIGTLCQLLIRPNQS